MVTKDNLWKETFIKLLDKYYEEMQKHKNMKNMGR